MGSLLNLALTIDGLSVTLLTLVAAALWGSWMQVIKHLKGYPLGGLVFWLYGFSALLVYGVTWALSPWLLPEGIWASLKAVPEANMEILFGGFIMSIGMYISLVLMRDMGLLLTAAITGAAGSVLGVVTSVVKEGWPDVPHAAELIVAGTGIFIMAGLLCNYAAKLRDEDVAEAQGVTGYKGKNKITAYVVVMALLNVVLTNGWSVGTATGTAYRLPPLVTAVYMVTGSFASILIISCVQFTRKGQWREVLCIGRDKKPLVLGALSALGHYGGNLISIYAMPVLTATMSFLYGRTSTLWTYGWGLYYGEFGGAKLRTLVILGVGLALYLLGTLLLGGMTL